MKVKKPILETAVAEEPGSELFIELKTKVLTPKCIGCHSIYKTEEGFQKKGMTLGEPAVSEIFIQVDQDRMPKGTELENGAEGKVIPLSPEEKELIRNYILKARPVDQATLPPTAVVPPQPPVEEKPSFGTLKTEILAPKCLQCHDDWQDEEEFGKKLIPGEALSSQVYDSVLQKRMPLGLDPLSERELELLKNYINSLPVRPAPVAAKPNFRILKRKVLAPNCLSCHSSWKIEKNFEKMIVPGKAESSQAYQSVVEKRMPLGRRPLEEREIELLRNYINALPTRTAPTPPLPLPPVEENPSFVKLKKEVLIPKCINCHSGFHSEEDFGKRIVPGDAESSPAYESVREKRMPIGSDPLNEKELQLMRDYINAL